MKSEEESGIIIAKIGHGEELLPSLLQIARRHGISSGIIIGGIGMLKGAKLGFYGGAGKYDEAVLEGPLELVSMQGNISRKGKETVLHLHVALSDIKKNMKGGHLLGATVHMVNEIKILRLNEIRLTRKRSGKSGLNELRIER
jgi:predicted DNA-binding protein with PD1-like motif